MDKRSLVTKQIFMMTAVILFIEIVILIPSVHFYKKRLIANETERLNAVIQSIGPVIEQALQSKDENLMALIYEGLREAEVAYAFTAVTPGGRKLSKGDSRLSPVEAEALIGTAKRGDHAFSYHPDKFCSLAVPLALGDDGNPLVLCVEKDMGHVKQQVYAYIARTTGLIFLILSLNGMVIYGFVSRIYLKPIRRLIAANKDLALGKAEGSFIAERDIPDDELGDVMRARHEMLLTLQRREEEIADKNKKLEELIKFKDAFSAMVSHDIRQPITVIKGYADFIRMDHPSNEGILKNTAAILNAADDLGRFANELLDLSKLQSGKIDIRKRKTDLSELIRKSVEENRILARNKGIQIALETNGSLEANIDPPKIAQVINNLIGNAIKFTRDNGSIHVFLNRTAPDRFLIKVTDNGVGIEKEKLAKVFETYVKSETGGTRGEKGYGLGLAICKNLVELHGGKIWAGSEMGEGSTFFVELPGTVSR